MKTTVRFVFIVLLLLVTCSDKAKTAVPDLESKIALCKQAADLLPATCNPGNPLTEENGGLFNIEVTLKCGTSISCTWACVRGRQRSKSFSLKHGPWSLCELCFSTDPLPKACFQTSPAPAKQPGKQPT